MSIASKSQASNIEVVWFFFKQHKAKTVLVLLLMFLSGFLESLNLAVLYPIIHYGLQVETHTELSLLLSRVVSALGTDNLFLSSCLLLLIVTILAAISKVAYHYASNYLVRDITGKKQKDIFKKLCRVEFKHFVKSQQGRLIYTGTLGTVGAAQIILYALRLIHSTLNCLFLIVLMTLLSWHGTLLVIVLGLLYVLFVKRILDKVVKKYARLTLEEDQRKNVILNEFITGIKTIMAFHAQGYWQKKYNQAVNNSVLYQFRVMMGRVLPDSFLKFIFFMAMGVLGLELNRLYQGNLVALLPALGTFVAVASRLVPYINLAGNDLVGIIRFMPDCRNVYDSLTEDIHERSEGTQTLEDFKRSIEFQDVSFQYEGMDEPLLKHINFTIEKNQMTAIVGSSGAGKSTIVSLLLGLYRPTSGSIKIDGINTCELREDSYLQQIGYVGQETFIFNGTIKENIQFGLNETTDDEIKEAAQLANAHDFIVATELGYETIVGDSGMKISGGQRQRIAIARAMLRKPKILILDEATSSLDNISEKIIQEAVGQISKRITVIVIAHRLTSVQNADRIVVFEGGRIVEDGTHDELLQKGKTYHELYSS